jgi:nucleoside-diphosphate-sugar epimerase
MRIVGRGFLAHHFSSHPALPRDVVLFAAGVSDSHSVNARAYGEETAQLRDVLADCIHRRECLVYFSSAGAVYGDYPPGVREDMALAPVSEHGRHKAAIETLLCGSPVEYLILRLSNAVGPGQRSHQFVPALVEQVQSGVVTVWRGAHRDLVDVEDVVRLTVALLDAGCRREIFNLASGRSTPVEQVVDEIEAQLGVRAERRFIDRPDRYSVSIDKLRRTLGAEAVAHLTDGYFRTVIGRYMRSINRSVDLSIY